MSSIDTEEEADFLSDHPAEPSQIRQQVEHAAHLLPTQGPLEVFIHHNTLHALENLPFHDAVKVGYTRFGAEPYLPEQEYRSLLQDGRIQDDDLEAVVIEDLSEQNHKWIDGLGTREQVRLTMLRHPLHVGPDAELRWIVAETDALDRFRPEVSQEPRLRVLAGTRTWIQDSLANDSNLPDELTELFSKFGRNTSKWNDAAWESLTLHLLWWACRNGVRSCPVAPNPANSLRPRDMLLHATGHDIDRYVDDVLIRFCIAFTDQGYSDWILPNRNEGFFESFLTLYSDRSPGLSRWMRGLSEELTNLSRNGTTPDESIEASLRELEIAETDQQEFITQSLMTLRGWAGMIWQLESGVDWVVHSIPKGSLVGMLAAQLILEKHAIRHIGEDQFGETESIPAILQSARESLTQQTPLNVERRAFLLFQTAQMLGWQPQQLMSLSKVEWQQLSEEIDSFSGIERRRIYHEAYERKYRHAALDAFATHASRRKSIAAPWGSQRPKFQIATCLDDREESFRRHLEEIQPLCETFGVAGFFAIAIYYRGATDGFYKPLCPAVITPDHYVQEDVGYTFEGVHRERAELRRKIGLARRAFHTRSRTFLGGIAAGIVGSLATVPLVARVLFPHLTSRIRRRFGSLLQPPPVTKLQLERYADDPGPENGHIGFTIDEMANVVVRLLQDMGVTTPNAFSRMFIICGHGSSSLNNPHESAYCCGACAGKRGGPNARAFAQMANDWRVRAKVASQGIKIPDDTVFVGAYHNTCDDSVVFYDLDRLPGSHRDDFESARESIENARRRNAHERCRRFDSAPLSLTPDEALRHVEGRAQDISQVRPEYNHATNTLCVVGRRDWTRGLYMDRRAFVTTYDPTQDDAEHSILLRILAAAIPVCAGINLEYYFSRVDTTTYGSGSKLPHNIASLLGVMEGTSSDLRTGLYQQMVEIHEPLRILFVIETTPEAMLSIIERNETIGRLCRGSWVHLATIDPETSKIQIYRNGEFEAYETNGNELSVADSSLACYQGSRDHLPFTSIRETELVQ